MADTRTTCFHHTDRETGRRCTRCGRYACPDCLRDASVGAQCWQCVRDAAPPRRAQLGRRLAAEPLLAAKALIAANLGVAVLLSVQGANVLNLGFAGPDDPRLRWVLFAPAIDLGGEWWRIFTSGFVHFGLMHILFNLLILYQVALVLERVAGPTRFLTIYAVSMIAGSLGALLMDPLARTGGASGAVFGVAGAATLLLYRQGVPFWHTGYGPLLAINLVLTFLVPRISIGGHLGGLAGGAVLGWILLRPTPTARDRVSVYAMAIGLGVVLFGACLWAAGRWDQAFT